MYRKLALASGLSLLLGACTAGRSSQATRIDGSSAAGAQATFRQMREEQRGDDRAQLLGAVIAIHFKGVASAHEVMRRPELQQPSIAGIRDEVDGMTAEQIVAYAAEVSTVQIEVDGR